MDYNKLDRMARAEGSTSLRFKLATMMENASIARKRNENGDTPTSLSRGIRKVRFMLGRAVSNEGRTKEKSREEAPARTSSSFSSSRSLSNPEAHGRITKFGEGVEMLTPTPWNEIYFNHENGERLKAYILYAGRAVSRNKRGEATVSDRISYMPFGKDVRFQNGKPHLQMLNSEIEAIEKCVEAVREQERARASKETTRTAQTARIEWGHWWESK